MKFTIHTLIFCLFFISSKAQITFQKQYQQPDSGSSLQTYDSKATPDGGYVMAGLASDSTSITYRPFILKVNCKGEIIWYKSFGTTQTTSNVMHKVIVTQDGNYVLLSNLGVYTNYNGFVVKLDTLGNVLWQKTINPSNGSDVLTDIKETSTGHLILTGNINSTPDVGLIKLNANGTLVWSKSIGTNGFFDEGSSINELSDGNYLLTGRYISMGAFNAFLMKTDTSGNLLWLKCYGDSLHSTWGFDVKEMPNGNLVLAGSTTLAKFNYQSFSDNFVMQLNPTGDTLWTKIFYGSPDQFENVSSIAFDAGGNILLGVATASYPYVGAVANKNAVFKFSTSGNLLLAKTYNTGSSHYTRLHPAPDGGFVLSAFSNRYGGPLGFQTLLMKLDDTLHSGCFETDVTNLTIVTQKTFKITQPGSSLITSGSVINNTSTSNIDLSDTTLCISLPALNATFTSSGHCIGDTTFFQADTTGVISYFWDFGDIGNADTSWLPSPSYLYTDTGSYNVRLIVSNGCESDTLYQQVIIFDTTFNFSLGPDSQIVAGNTIQIGFSANGANYAWNTGDTTSHISVSTSGTYILTIQLGNCASHTDTLVITATHLSAGESPEYHPCHLTLPNAFSPNGDGLNDLLKPLGIPLGQGVEFIQFEIYNRWGNRVFFTKDPTQGWDGTYNGSPADVESYFYYVRYRCRGEQQIYKGNVLLIR
jgi:gliding motility-associated-like protein